MFWDDYLRWCFWVRVPNALDWGMVVSWLARAFTHSTWKMLQCFAAERTDDGWWWLNWSLSMQNIVVVVVKLKLMKFVIDGPLFRFRIICNSILINDEANVSCFLLCCCFCWFAVFCSQKANHQPSDDSLMNSGRCQTIARWNWNEIRSCRLRSIWKLILAYISSMAVHSTDSRQK